MTKQCICSTFLKNAHIYIYIYITHYFLKKYFLAYLKPWDHSKIVNLELLIRPVSLRAHQTSKTPHSWQNNVPSVCRVCVSLVSGVCQPARNQKSAASPKRKIRHQPEIKIGPPPPLPATLFATNCTGHNFSMMLRTRSLCRPVSREWYKFHFRRCSIRKACVGPPT